MKGKVVATIAALVLAAAISSTAGQDVDIIPSRKVSCKP